MNYSTIFTATCSAERFAAVSGKVAVRVFGFTVWAIALLALGFVNGCVNSYQLGRDARAWWDESGREYCALKLAPCVAAASVAVAWTFGIDRYWSAQRLPATLEVNAEFWAEVKAEYIATGDRAVRFAISSVDSACSLSTAGVRLIAG